MTESLPNSSPFPSLDAVKRFNSDLRSRYAKADDKHGFVGEIEKFLERGRATGAVIDEEEDRWACQSLLDYWLTILYEHGDSDADSTLAAFDPDNAPEIPDEKCPYVGLADFSEERSDRFMGRKSLVKKMLTQLEAGPPYLLLVTGPSGAGTSSVVKAGLIPQLKKGALPGSDTWMYLPPMVPDDDPNGSLAELLKNAPADASPRVIVIDQLEELFTLCHDQGERDAFSETIRDRLLAGDRIIAIMRSQFTPFLAKLAHQEDFLDEAQVVVTPMRAPEIRQAIEEPAKQVGLKFDKGVVDRLVVDLVGEPAGLALLQFTLMKLWENRQRNRITMDAYKKIGGGRLALAHCADKLYDSFTPEEQRVCKKLFFQIMQPGIGLDVIRKRLPMERLSLVHEKTEVVERVLHQLIEARLLRTSEVGTGDSHDIEIVHEALLRNWPTLAEWLDEARIAERFRGRLAVAAEVWQQNDQNDDYLYRDNQLEDAERQIGQFEDELSLGPDQKAFIDASRRYREHARKVAVRKRRVLASAALLAVMAVAVSAVVAQLANKELDKKNHELSGALRKVGQNWMERANEAGEQKNFFAAAVMSGKALGFRGFGYEKIESKYRGNFTEYIRANTAIREKVKRDFQKGFPLWQTNLTASEGAEKPMVGIISVSFSSSGEYVVTGLADGTVEVRSADKGDIVRILSSGPDATDMAWNEKEKRLAIAGSQGLFLHQLQESDYNEGPLIPLVPIADTKLSVLAFDPNGNTLAGVVANAEEKSDIRLWDLDTFPQPREVKKLSAEEVLTCVAFSPDGRLLAGGTANGKVRFWDRETGNPVKLTKQLGELEHRNAVTSLAFHPTKHFLATGSTDKSIKLWDFGREKLFAVTKKLHKHEIVDLKFGQDGNTMASSASDGRVMIWNLKRKQDTHAVRLITKIDELPEEMDKAQCPLVILALVEGRLHLKIFDWQGLVVFEASESELDAGDKLVKLKQTLSDYGSRPDELDESKKHEIIADAFDVAELELNLLQPRLVLSGTPDRRPMIALSPRGSRLVLGDRPNPLERDIGATKEYDYGILRMWSLGSETAGEIPDPDIARYLNQGWCKLVDSRLEFLSNTKALSADLRPEAEAGPETNAGKETPLAWLDRIKFHSQEVREAGENFTVAALHMEMIWVPAIEGWVGETEVTQKQWKMGSGKKVSTYPGENHPVDSVSRREAMAFCNRLTESENREGRLPEGFIYTLPTVEQWERYGNADPEHGVFRRPKEDGYGTTAVKSKSKNDAGLYDVLGNVAEWTCSSDPDSEKENHYFVMGGSFGIPKANILTELERSSPEDAKWHEYGFRCVLVKRDSDQKETP